MRTSFERVKNPEAAMQIRSGNRSHTKIAETFREASNGKRARSLERGDQSLEGESSEGKSQERYGVK